MNLSFPVRGVAAAVLSAVGLAQSPPFGPTPAAITGSCGLQWHDGALCGVGPEYKVRFTEGRVEFTPSLGRSAPRTLPVVLRARSVEREDAAGAPMALDPVAPTWRDLRVDLARGPVLESYELRAGGIEQSFRFDVLPAGRGDLVVRLDLETECTVSDDARGLRFEVSGAGGGCLLTDVVGIDAGGQRAPGSIGRRGNEVTLRLPAAFVDRAALPLVLDPLLGSVFNVHAATSDDEQPDVAFDNSKNRYLVVWRHFASATDIDVYGRFVDGFGNPLGNALIIANSSLQETEPSVADIALRDAFLVTFTFNNDVLARSVDALTGAVSAAAVIGGGSGSQRHGDIGGESTGTDDRGVCVWKDDATNSILSAAVAIDPNRSVRVAAGPFTVFTAASSTTPLANPSIAKSNGINRRYGVVFQSDLSGGKNSNPYFAVLDGTSFPLVGGTVIDLQTTDDDLPDVDGDGSTWLVVWQKLGVNEHDIVGQSWSYVPGLGLTADSNPTTIEGGVADQVMPTVTWLGQTFLVGCAELRTPGTNIWSAFTRSVGMFGSQSCEGRFFVAGTGTLNGPPRGASTRSGGSGIREDALLVFESSNPANLNGDIVASMWRTADGVVTDLGGGCGQGGMQMTPCAVLGNGQFWLHLRDATPNGLAVLLLSTARLDLTCGSCRLVPDPSFGLQFVNRNDAFGSNTVTVAIPNLPGLRTVPFYVQWATQTTTASGCGAITTLSNASRFIIE